MCGGVGRGQPRQQTTKTPKPPNHLPTQVPHPRQGSHPQAPRNIADNAQTPDPKTLRRGGHVPPRAPPSPGKGQGGCFWEVDCGARHVKRILKELQRALSGGVRKPAVPPKSGLWCAPMFLDLGSATVAPGGCGEQRWPHTPPIPTHGPPCMDRAWTFPLGYPGHAGFLGTFRLTWQHTLFLHAHQRWGGHPHNLICGESSDFFLSVGAQSWWDCLTRCREIRPTKPFHNVIS
jgi:hypothetical protein